MKKQILNIGKTLNKTEQKAINGGGRFGGCSGICTKDEEDRQYYIDDQLERYGVDFSHCVCDDHGC